MANQRMLTLGQNRSVIRDLFEYGLQQKKLLGEDKVYDFSIGNPSIPAPETVKNALISLLENTEPTALHGYSSAPGDPAVRAAVAESINRRFGRNETAGDIYMTCGAAASLTISLSAVIEEEGEEVIVLSPYFPEYKVFAETAGAKVINVPARTDTFRPDLEKLTAAVNEKTRALILNSPNNPSGAVIPEEDLIAIAALLEKKQAEYGHPVFILADEPYRELVYDNAEVPYVMNYYTNTVVCYSYSKSLSLPGERIGYIAVCHECPVREELFAAICGAGRALGYVCAPVLFQKMLLTCMEEVSDISAYEQNKDILYRALTEYGYDCVKPEGAFYLFVKAPGGDDAAFSETAKKYNLLIVPSASFGLPGYVRMSYCVSEKTIRASLPAFKQLAEELGLIK